MGAHEDVDLETPLEEEKPSIRVVEGLREL